MFFHIYLGVLENTLAVADPEKCKDKEGLPTHLEKLMITSDIKNLFSLIIDDIVWHSLQHDIVTFFLTSFLNAH